MDELWNAVRVANFVIFFICFIVAVYKFVLRTVEYENAFRWDRFMNFVWLFASMYGTGEILYVQGVLGGPRVFVFTAIGVLQLYVVLFHYRMKDEEPTPRI